MTVESIEQRLSRITTCWSKVFEAHQGGQDTVATARRDLLERYRGAIYRYAAAALRDADAAEEVLQEFAVCFVRGDFRGANPERGRFRDLVKTVLFHLIVNYQRQQQRLARQRPLTDSIDLPDPNSPDAASDADREFIKLWREELLDRAWIALEQHERRAGNAFYTALRRHAEQPSLSSEQLAQILGEVSGRSFTASGVRQTLHRAREEFANLLIDEVGRSLETVQRDSVEQELIDLDLLVYCKSAMQKRFPR
jgi:RNA polymerase sigma-70 factor (ECF subfamily)